MGRKPEFILRVQVGAKNQEGGANSRGPERELGLETDAFLRYQEFCRLAGLISRNTQR